MGLLPVSEICQGEKPIKRIRASFKEVLNFCLLLGNYLASRIHQGAHHFEFFKNFIVDKLLWKRGILHRPFTHASLLGIAFVVLVSAAVFKGTTLFATSFEIDENVQGEQTQIAVTYTNPVTIISEKPRDEIIEYEVKGGDTVSGVAQEFSVTVNTIRWANNLADADDIHPGDKLKILPVAGVAHTVRSGDTIFSVAKKYQAEPQAILDFPFNDVGDDFALSIGQVLIIPDGAPPEKPKPPPVQYLARVNVPSQSSEASGLFRWPTTGYIGQYFAYYHKGIDIVNSSAPDVVAADSGKVTVSGWPDNSGYGRRVVVDHGNGYSTLYAHLASAYVGAGEYVSKGERIGKMGTTGRSTGIHLHLEIYKNGVAQNPLSYLK